MSAKKEVYEYAYDRLNDGIGEDQYGGDLHNEIYNTDYFVIGHYPAKQFLDKVDGGVFEAIETIKDYEQNNFGQVSTDFSSPEKVANMYAYIVGEEILYGSDHLQKAWDRKLTEDDLDKIKEEIDY